MHADKGVSYQHIQTKVITEQFVDLGEGRAGTHEGLNRDLERKTWLQIVYSCIKFSSKLEKCSQRSLQNIQCW